jgi:hypothetical protein
MILRGGRDARSRQAILGAGARLLAVAVQAIDQPAAHAAGVACDLGILYAQSDSAA